MQVEFLIIQLMSVFIFLTSLFNFVSTQLPDIPACYKYSHYKHCPEPLYHLCGVGDNSDTSEDVCCSYYHECCKVIIGGAIKSVCCRRSWTTSMENTGIILSVVTLIVVLPFSAFFCVRFCFKH